MKALDTKTTEQVSGGKGTKTHIGGKIAGGIAGSLADWALGKIH